MVGPRYEHSPRRWRRSSHRGKSTRPLDTFYSKHSLTSITSHVGLPPFSKTENGYVMHLLGKPDMVLPWTYIDRDMGPAVTALMKQYDTRSSEIIGRTFVLGVARATAEEVAAEFARGESRCSPYEALLIAAYRSG